MSSDQASAMRSEVESREAALPPTDGLDNVLGEVVSRLKIGGEIFWKPARLVQFEHWAGHIPAAFWLAKVVRPKLLVELGTHRGNSYCAFCQAIETFGIEAKAFAVDTWEGDVHMRRELGVLDDLRQHHDPRYGWFSTLMQAQFDEARQYFDSGSVDLLHLDGTHTYDAVKADFYSWLPTLSDRGVVLFHDTSERKQDFGVWRLWQELSREFPSFEFPHSHGLGVLGVGRDLPAPLRALFEIASEPELANCTRQLFAQCGEAWTLRLGLEKYSQDLRLQYGRELQELRRSVVTKTGHFEALQATHARVEKTLREELSKRNSKVEELSQKLRVSRGRLSELYGSRSWRITKPLRAPRRLLNAASVYLRRSLLKTDRKAQVTKSVARDALEATYSAAWDQATASKQELSFAEIARVPANPERCDVKLIAYYLPQFHPIPENDAWWGPGFTEWRNVAKSVPVFVGHRQPNLPGELGFYDLRVPDVMYRQAELARLYGISAFCFHFYWFGGKRLLEGPLLSFLDRPDIDIQFCLCWANENWTRKWDGAENELLIGQSHSPEDDVAFIRYLKRYFDDPRYVKIDGKPVLTVYRPGILPHAQATVARWRNEVKDMGYPDLFLVATNSFGFSDAASLGFDALSEFPPHGTKTPHCRVAKLTDQFSGQIHEYQALVETEKGETGDQRLWPGVMPGWDNTPRLPASGRVFHGSTPTLFHQWLNGAIRRARRNPPAERVVLINAWNEWAEGAYLEPDRRFGYAYLGACGAAVREQAAVDEDVAALLREARERFRPKSSLAVLLHLSLDSPIEELPPKIKAFGDVDAYVTVPKDISLAAARLVTEAFPEAYILEVDCRGRDMLPFTRMLKRLKDHNYEFVCKLHTNATRLGDGVEPPDVLLSPAARSILTSAKELKDVGVVADRRTIRKIGREYPQVFRDLLERLALEMGTKLTFEEQFVAGSMFWFRPDALGKFERLALVEQYEPELGQVDFTLSHALERLAAVAVSAAGYKLVEIN